jgi:hypothetical protein
MAKSYAERHGLVGNGNGNNTNPNQKPRELTQRINVKPAKMESLCANKLATTADLNQMVYRLFKTSCPEFEGCDIQVGQQGITCDIFLSEVSDSLFSEGSKIKLIQRRGAKKDSGSFSEIERYNNRNRRSSVYELTEGGKDALSEFVDYSAYTNRQQNRVDWKKLVTEVSESDWYGRNRIYVKVRISLERVLGKIYGTKDEETDDKFVYLITPSRPITTYQGANGNLFTSSWMFTIMQLNHAQLEEAMAKSGFAPNQVGSIHMYRGQA